jgi:hypothetical protein
MLPAAEFQGCAIHKLKHNIAKNKNSPMNLKIGIFLPLNFTEIHPCLVENIWNI